jgi:drug/metabolite transporter (DMT)-like permease
MKHLSNPGVLAALGAAALFGAGTPLAKLLLGSVDPWLLAGLLYLGSGVGLTLTRLIRRAPLVRPKGREWGWLAGAIVAGGIVGPVLLMFGLSAMPASGASLLLNAEGAFTALLAWFVFRENFDRRIALGMAAIVAGAVVLAWPDDARRRPVAVTRRAGRVPGMGGGQQPDPQSISCGCNLDCRLQGLGGRGGQLRHRGNGLQPLAGMADGIGRRRSGLARLRRQPFTFCRGLRHLGTARTGAYFSVAPFVGALVAVLLLDEPVTPRLIAAGTLMGLGVWLHLTERHEHEHTHEALFHTHEHVHDEHHRHTHDFPVEPGTRHTHAHWHEPITHMHPHFPDAHHRHSH